MKTKILIVVVSTLMTQFINAQGVSINETGEDAHSSAILHLSSENKGFIPPVMTSAQRNDIVNPATGLMIYNSESNCLEFFNGTDWFNVCAGSVSPISNYPSGFVHCNPSNLTSVVEVVNPSTGEIWMDRNLGANRAATSSTDVQAFGSLYQWGRFADGHQCVHRYVGDAVSNSGTTTIHASTAEPNAGNLWDGLFVLHQGGTSNWLTLSDNNLWQGANGTNNPCPENFRLPTEAEWTAEMGSWSVNSISGAFASPLKLTASGSRNILTGNVDHIGNFGFYWSSTIDPLNINSSRLMRFLVDDAGMISSGRNSGFAVRCIKN